MTNQLYLHYITIYILVVALTLARREVNVLLVALLTEQRAVDSDENIMEGGVTIRRRRKTRAPVRQPAFAQSKRKRVSKTDELLSLIITTRDTHVDFFGRGGGANANPLDLPPLTSAESLLYHFVWEFIWKTVIYAYSLNCLF